MVVGVCPSAAHAGHRRQPPSPRARGARGRQRPVGPRAGRHGRDLPGARAQAREAAGANHQDPRARVLDRRAGLVRATGATLESGERIEAALVVSGAHPRTTVLELAGASHFPGQVVRDMERYRTRGGSVKVNCALSMPPRYEGVSDVRPRAPAAHRPSAMPVDRLPRACVAGREREACRPRAPYVEVEVPSAVDPSLTDDVSGATTMFTEYGPALRRRRLARGRSGGVRRVLPRHRGAPRVRT